MTDASLMDVVDASWAEALGCEIGLLRSPGIHLVPGGPGFAGYNAVYLARLDVAVLVYCPKPLRAVARKASTAVQPTGPSRVGLSSGSPVTA